MTKEYLTMDLRDLVPYGNNPRFNDDAVPIVQRSFAECGGYISPIVIDEQNVILAGHTRLKALLADGSTTADVLRVTGLTDDQKKKYRLLDNKAGEAAEWDLDALAAELDGLDFGGFDFGFGEQGNEVDADDTEEAALDAVSEDDYNPEETVAETRVRAGDVWSLGRHRLICGDSTDKKVLTRLMGGAEADMLLTDPPYGVSYVGKTADALTIDNDSMVDREFLAFLTKAFKAADGALKPGGAFYIWHADLRSLVFREAAAAAGWTIRQCLVWVKNVFVLGRQDYQWKHEPCLYGWKDGAAHSFVDLRNETTVQEDEREAPDIDNMTADELRALIREAPTTVMVEQKPPRNAMHPTMKPIKLMARCIRNSTRPGDIVLDTFGGSGSTLLAAQQMGRVCYTCELDPHYCDVILDRWEQYTGQTAHRERS